MAETGINADYKMTLNLNGPLTSRVEVDSFHCVLAFHDSFAGHEMALSGMVLWPVPKMPKALKKLNPPKTRSETYTEEADDGSTSAEGSGGDDEDDEDDTR